MKKYLIMLIDRQISNTPVTLTHSEFNSDTWMAMID